VVVIALLLFLLMSLPTQSDMNIVILTVDIGLESLRPLLDKLNDSGGVPDVPERTCEYIVAQPDTLLTDL